MRKELWKAGRAAAEKWGPISEGKKTDESENRLSPDFWLWEQKSRYWRPIYDDSSVLTGKSRCRKTARDPKRLEA